MKKFLQLAPLFMVILIDVMGIVLVLPVLTVLILDPASTLISPDIPEFWRDFFYGLAIALYPLFMFFSTPILGDLSDKLGRKKILLFCLLGAAVSYLISVLALEMNSLLLFLASRAFAGLAAGTQSIARAAIIDLSDESNKTKNLAWVVFVCSLGVILGPLVGGLSSEKSLASWLSFAMPFYLSALITLVCLVLLAITYQDKRVLQKQEKIEFFKGFHLFLLAFKDIKFRLIAISYFCYILAWGLYFETINWYLLEKFHYTARQLGFFMAYIGIIFAIASSIGVRIVLRLIPNERSAMSVFIMLMAFSLFGVALSYSETAQWGWVILIGCADVLCYTFCLSIFSSLADKNSQGWVMGSMGAIDSLTWGLGSLLTGPLGYISLKLPFWIGGILCLTSYVTMMIFRRLKD